VISDINPADKPHVQIAGFLQDKLHTSEQPDRGTWTRTWLTPAGIGPKIPTIIPPEVPLPTESKWTRHMLAGQALPSTDGAPGPFRFLVDRIVPPEVTTAYANKWLKAEHSHLARVGELCDMDALRETWTAKAQRQAAELTQRQELYDRAKALPLIVLAGLK
jgi:hypothetical protein